MKILLVAATRPEIAPLLKTRKPGSKKGAVSTYRAGRHTIDVLITGVGMTATAFQMGKTLSRKYDLAINAGIAGSFRRFIPPGTVVHVVTDCFGDLGVEDGKKFLTAHEIGLVDKSAHTLSESGYKKPLGLIAVRGITVNTVHGEVKSIRKVLNKFDPDIESMEGAAFFLACGLEKVPCIQVRAISNYVEKRNREKWQMGLAIKNLNLFLEKFLLETLS